MLVKETECGGFPMGLKKMKFQDPHLMGSLCGMYLCFCECMLMLGFPGGTSGKESACQCGRHKEMQVQSLSWEDPLEKKIAAHPSILA